MRVLCTHLWPPVFWCLWQCSWQRWWSACWSSPTRSCPSVTPAGQRRRKKKGCFSLLMGGRRGTTRYELMPISAWLSLTHKQAAVPTWGQVLATTKHLLCTSTHAQCPLLELLAHVNTCAGYSPTNQPDRQNFDYSNISVIRTLEVIIIDSKSHALTGFECAMKLKVCMVKSLSP